MDKFIGSWEETTVENLDKLLEAVDLPDDTKTRFREMKLVVKYEKIGDHYQLEAKQKDGTVVNTHRFKLGETFEARGLDGEPISGHIDFIDGKLVETHTDTENAARNVEFKSHVQGHELITEISFHGLKVLAKCTKLK